MQHQAEMMAGKHRVLIDGFIVTIDFDGLFELPEFEQQCRVMDEVRAQHGRVYLIALTARAKAMPPQVRQAMGVYMKTHKLGGVANVAASLFARGIALLIRHGIELVYGPTAPLTFCQTEEEARAWIAELDKKWLASGDAAG